MVITAQTPCRLRAMPTICRLIPVLKAEVLVITIPQTGHSNILRVAPSHHQDKQHAKQTEATKFRNLHLAIMCIIVVVTTLHVRTHHNPRLARRVTTTQSLRLHAVVVRALEEVAITGILFSNQRVANLISERNAYKSFFKIFLCVCSDEQ